MNAFNRLHALRMENDAKGFEMDGERGRFDALRTRHEDGTAPRAVSSFNLFQTPETLAARLSGMIADTNPQTILEPSAGLGRLLFSMLDAMPEAQYTAVEEAPELCGELYRTTEGKSVTLIQRDFLTCDFDDGFDAILMNPPFKMGRDVKHIEHALKFLNPGGLLISLVYNGVKQNKRFKDAPGWTWEDLPKGTFKAEGTSAETAIITTIKPA